jgi:HlyD family secretion protein
MLVKKQFKGMVTSISNSASSALTADQANFKVKVRIVKESYEDLGWKTISLFSLSDQE